MKKWHTTVAARVAQRRAVRHTAEFLVAAGVALVVQFAALPGVCRAAALGNLLHLVGL